MADAVSIPTVNPITSVALGVKPPNAISLTDMMNMATGAQAYQQAKQLNPVQLESARTVLQGQQQQTESGALDLEKAKQLNKERLITQEWIQNGNHLDANGNIDINKLQNLSKIAPLTASDTINKITTLDTATSGANEAKLKLNQNERSAVAGVIGELAYSGEQNPYKYIAALDNFSKTTKNKSMLEMIDNYKTILKNVPAGEHIATEALNLSQSLITPEQQYEKFAPKVGTASTGVKTLETITQPSVAGKEGSITIGTEPLLESEQVQTINGKQYVVNLNTGEARPLASASTQPAQPTFDMNKSIYSQTEKLPYPVRSGAVAYTAEPSEEADKLSGFNQRQILVDAQSNLVTNKRNIEEVKNSAEKILKSATLPETGRIGQAKRAIAEFTGNTEYQQLAKDLANAQLSNMRALGLPVNSNEGLELQKVASGSITVDPSISIKIANRALADMTQIDLKADGAQKFFEKYGDNNAKAFQKMWSKNADSKIFQIINIADDPKLSSKEKQKMTEELIGFKYTDNSVEARKARRIFSEKLQNIQKLSETGSL